MTKGSLGGRGSGTVSNAAYRDIRAARSSVGQFHVRKITKSGEPSKSPSESVRTLGEAHRKANLISGYNPGVKFVVTNDQGKVMPEKWTAERKIMAQAMRGARNEVRRKTADLEAGGRDLRMEEQAAKGRGNWGHKGRKGMRGGSA
jgi:hypothetical protein